MYTTRTPAPFSVRIRKTDLRVYKDFVTSNYGGTNAYFHNYDKIMDKFEGHNELVVYPLPGFRYTTDLEVAKAYFKGLK